MRSQIKITHILIITVLSLIGAAALTTVLAFILPPATAPVSLSAAVMPEWQQLIAPERDVLYYRCFIVSACLLALVMMGLFRTQLKLPNVLFASTLSVCAAALLTTAAYFISLRTPYPANNLLSQIFPFFSDMIRPEREMQLYAFFILCAVVFQLLWLRLAWPSRQVVPFSKINDLYAFKRPAWSLTWMDAAVMAVTSAMLLIPDCRYALACIFLGDQAQHFDSFVGGPAWAAVSGNILDVDTVSHYGIGMPVLIGHAAEAFGGGHLGLLKVMMLCNWLYFMAWYVLLRLWFSSTAFAAAALWCAIRLQMFNTNEFPCVFNYPSATVMRFFWDILFFWCVWMFLHEPQKKRYLAGAAITAGVAVFYMSSTGMCLVLTFGALLLWLFVSQRMTWGKALSLAGWGALMLISAFTALAFTQGRHVIDPKFWSDVGDFNKYFLNGFGALPVTEALQVKKYWAFAMGLFIPVSYVWSLVYVAARIVLRRSGREAVFVGLLCLYGLGLYHYFVSRSSPYGFYTVAVVWVIVMFYWLLHISRKLHWKISAAVAAAAFFLLWINPQFAAYPNVFKGLRYDLSKGVGVLPLPKGGEYFNHTVIKTSRIPVPNSLGDYQEGLVTENDFHDPRELKDYFKRAFDFSDDARFIDALTQEKDKVALLSSFDVMILMQAKRRPFFYCYPTFLSRPLRMYSMAVPEIYTLDQLKRTITQIETQRPKYIFIEKIYAPQNIMFANNTHALQLLLLYVYQHYAPGPQGKYLMALQRR